MIAEKEFSNNLESVQEKIAIACEASDRALKEVTLLPVTKNWSADAVKLCKGSGITRVGENRVQEAIQKMEVVQGVEFDLIGHLQGNKAKQVIGKFSCIQSVDSLKLLEKLERLARRNNLIQPILLQINAGNDPAKHGISIENASYIENNLEVENTLDKVDVGAEHTPKLFSEEPNYQSEEMTTESSDQENNESDQLFDQDISEEEDFEIPAFLRKQKF